MCKSRFIVLPNITLVISEEYATLSPIMKLFNFRKSRNFIAEITKDAAVSYLTFEFIVIMFFKYSINALSFAIKEIEKEINTIHTLSFTITTKERYRTILG